MSPHCQGGARSPPFQKSAFFFFAATGGGHATTQVLFSFFLEGRKGNGAMCPSNPWPSSAQDRGSTSCVTGPATLLQVVFFTSFQFPCGHHNSRRTQNERPRQGSYDIPTGTRLLFSPLIGLPVVEPGWRRQHGTRLSSCVSRWMAEPSPRNAFYFGTRRMRHYRYR